MNSTLPVAFMQRLVAVEQHLQAMSDVLIAGDAVGFEGHCSALQSLMSDLSHAYRAIPSEVAASRALKNRLRVLGQSVALQRESMARRAVAVDRELQVILPSQQVPTYGRPVGGYGQNGRTVGRFTSMHA